jgi:type I restriction enzyme S subunit
MPSLNTKLLSDVPIYFPTLDQQREAGKLLTQLDDRITLLRETNATLEAIAQALFKSWFVDFDPVHAKMQGRVPEGMDEATAALFPDGFEESELGLVPKGWRAMTLGEICSVTIGGLWGNDEPDDKELTPAISLRGVDLEYLRVEGFAKNAPVRWVKPSAMEKRRLSGNEVLIASSGAGPCGRPLWAGAGFESLYGMPVIFSNFVKRLDCSSPARAIFIDRLLAEMRDTQEIWNYINGTSIPNLDDKLLLATKKVIVPNNAILSAFESVARAIYEQLYSQQAQTLATLRDTLLPRLISGQLRPNSI